MALALATSLVARTAEYSATNEFETLNLEQALQLAERLQPERAEAKALIEAAEGRFAAGDIGLAELLPVRRDWAAVQLTYLESLRDVMQSWAALRSFINQSSAKLQ